MLYKSIEYNILSLLQTVGPLKSEQLTRFFSDTVKEEKMGMILKELAYTSSIGYDQETDTYRYHADPEVISEIQQKIIRAFWVPAMVKSQNILQFFRLEYPSQLMFITTTNNVYDISVCTSENIAQIIGSRRRLNEKVLGEDIINHIAIVQDPKLGAKLGKYSFNSYGIIDPITHEVNYDLC